MGSYYVHKKLSKKSLEIKDINDLLIEIFLRLPIYSIQLFLTVCKNWQSILTNPTFRKQWRKRNIKPSTGLFLPKGNPTSISFFTFSPIEIKIPSLRTDFEIENSCNGLLLCKTTNVTYHVYNPTNGTCRTLPDLDNGVVVPGSMIVRSMCLAFDPNRFGDCYKVVCFVGEDTRFPAPTHIYVYSSETGVWKKSVLTTRLNLGHVYFDKGVYWNGCIHFIGCVYFDIENETMHRIPSPQECGGLFIVGCYLGESCDCLIFVKCWIKDWHCRSVDVFELKRDSSEWISKYHVELDCLPFVTRMLLSVVRGVEGEDPFLVLETRQGIVRYNLDSETFEEIPFLSTGGIFYRSGFQYIASQYRV